MQSPNGSLPHNRRTITGPVVSKTLQAPPARNTAPVGVIIAPSIAPSIAPPQNSGGPTLPSTAFTALTLTNNTAGTITFTLFVGHDAIIIPYTNLLLAGAMITVPLSGASYYLFASTGTLTIKADTGTVGDFVQGTGVEWIDGVASVIDRRTILPASGQSGSLPVENAATKNIVFTGSPIAPSTSVIFAGNGNGQALRKQIVIQNMDASNVLNVTDLANHIATILQPSSPPWTVETSDVIKVTNPSGAASVVVGILEVYYAS